MGKLVSTLSKLIHENLVSLWGKVLKRLHGKANIAGWKMDPDWRGISYWTWGIFDCFNASWDLEMEPCKSRFLLEASFFGLGVSFFSLEIFVGNTMTSTLPETDSKRPWKSMVGRCNFLLGWPIFSCFCWESRHLFPPESLEPNQRAPQKWMWPKFIGTNHRYTGDVDSEANLDLYGIGTGVTVSHHLGGEKMVGKNHYFICFPKPKIWFRFSKIS